MASAAFNFEWTPGQASPRRLARASAERVVTIDRSLELAIPVGARSLTDFLNEFEADPDVAIGLADARLEVADEIVAARGHITLKDLRLRKGMSQVEFAKAIGTSQPRVSRLESRAEKAAEDTLRTMANALDVDFNTLMEALAGGD
jgi:predicted XRE-type DNA-binding protein